MNNHNKRIRIPVTVNGEEGIPEQSEAQDELNETQETDCTELEGELEVAQQEANDYKDKYLRALAETENARKRLQKEKQEIIKYAVQQMALDLLIPIDHFEQALKASTQLSEEMQLWIKGFQMIVGQFKDVLANHGILKCKLPH